MLDSTTDSSNHWTAVKRFDLDPPAFAWFCTNDCGQTWDKCATVWVRGDCWCCSRICVGEYETFRASEDRIAALEDMEDFEDR